MIAIDDDIPAPLPVSSGRRLFPWHELEVGQSFLAPNRSTHSVASSATVFGRKLGRKFRTAKVEGGIRVWRVE